MKRRTYRKRTSDDIIASVMILSAVLGFVYGIITAEHTLYGFISSIFSNVLLFLVVSLLSMFAGYLIFCCIKAIIQIIRDFFNLLF